MVKAMVLRGIRALDQEAKPLELMEMERPKPERDQLLIRILACGICHTELDEIEGRAAPPQFPIILGHQAVGEVVERGAEVRDFAVGDRVGVGWIYSTCGSCSYCREGRENLCQYFKATGRDEHGGYAEYMTLPEISAHQIPKKFSHIEAAPLLCGGSIGFRSLRLTEIEDGDNLGLTGFGASNHLVLKMARHRYPKSRIFVFARREKTRDFARQLGASWAGDTEENCPEPLQAIIDTTPVWKPVVEALKNLQPGGRLVINAIRKEDVDRDYLLKLNYQKHLWHEKEIKSVANVTHSDIAQFLPLAAEIPIKAEVKTYPLEEANRALLDLKEGRGKGARVLVMDS